MKAVLFGSIGTVCDTSALGLKSDNQAFVENALDRHRPEAEYRCQLCTAGRLRRLQQFADEATTIDDKSVCVDAARAAGLRCLATPLSFSIDRDFSAASAVVSDQR